MTVQAVYEAIHNQVKATGNEVLPRGVLGFRVGGQQVYIPPPNFDELLHPMPANKAGAAIIAVGEFAQKAREIVTSTRLSPSGKDEDIRKLASQASPVLLGLLNEVGEALEETEALERKDLAPVPVPPADAAQAVVDVELRQITRAMPTHEQISFVRDNYAGLLAVMRQPIGFDGQFLDFARRIWAERNPNAKTMTDAMRMAKSWREARNQIGAAHAAFVKLSSAEGRAAADAANAAEAAKRLADAA